MIDDIKKIFKIGLTLLGISFILMGWLAPLPGTLFSLFYGSVIPRWEALKLLAKIILPLLAFTPFVLDCLVDLKRRGRFLLPALVLLIVGATLAVPALSQPFPVDVYNLSSGLFFGVEHPSESFSHLVTTAAKSSYEEYQKKYLQKDQGVTFGEIRYQAGSPDAAYNDVVLPLSFSAPENGTYKIFAYILTVREGKGFSNSQTVEKNFDLARGPNIVELIFRGQPIYEDTYHGGFNYKVDRLSICLSKKDFSSFHPDNCAAGFIYENVKPTLEIQKDKIIRSDVLLKK